MLREAFGEHCLSQRTVLIAFTFQGQSGIS
jgi:hypothetical protein